MVISFIQVHQVDEVDLLVVAEEGELVEAGVVHGAEWVAAVVAAVVVVRAFSKLSVYLS